MFICQARPETFLALGEVRVAERWPEGRIVPDGLLTILKYDHGHDTVGRKRTPQDCA